MKIIFCRVMPLAVAAVASLCLCSCGGGNGDGNGEKGEAIKVTGVTLNSSEISLVGGESETLKATVLPADASNPSVTWSTSDAKVATVSNGKVTAIGKGSATIAVVTASNSKRAVCKVTVVNMYISARVDSNDGKICTATLFTNGKSAALGSSSSSANSVFSSGSDVYVAGTDGDAPKLWKNGTAGSLGSRGYASSVFIYGTDVYVAENIYSNSKYNAVMWKNGNKTSLTDGTYYSNASSVAVSGGKVFVGGYEYNGTQLVGKKVAKIWTDGVSSALSDGKYDAAVNSIFVSGSDVYAAGYAFNGSITIARVWKNGSAVSDLPGGGHNAKVNCIYVSGSNIYAAGTVNNGKKNVATLWINGTSVTLSDGSDNADALGVSMFGKYIYATGYNSGSSSSMIWKIDASSMKLISSSPISGYATSIYISEN